MLAANDMIDLVSKTDIVFVDEAIFAPMFRPAGHFGPSLLTDVTAHGRESGELLPLPFSGCVQAP